MSGGEKREKRSRAQVASTSPDAWHARAVDACLAGAIILAPLAMGGRHPLGQLLLTVLAVTAAWSWAAGQCIVGGGWRRTAAAPLLLMGLGLLALQTIALPPQWLARLAPRTAEILPLWRANADGGAALGVWNTISFAPAETRAAMVLFLDYALLFLTAYQRIGRIEDVERLLRLTAVGAIVMAAFALIQLFAGNGKYFWFYEHPFTLASGSAKGSFGNRNHFAQFMALGVGPIIWWLQDALRRRRPSGRDAFLPAHGRRSYDRRQNHLAPPLLGLALGLVLFAGLLSLSRGGIAAMLLAAAVTTAVCIAAGALEKRFAVALAAAAALIVAALAIHGSKPVGNRLDDYAAGTLEKLDANAGRRTIWAATAWAIPDFISLGSGVGSFRHVYPMYTGLGADQRVEFSHAESSYLQNALETGVVGAALILAGIAMLVGWCGRSIGPATPRRARLAAAAIAGSMAAFLAHGLVDFVWYIPACMGVATILAAAVARIGQLRGEGRGERGEIKSGKWKAERTSGQWPVVSGHAIKNPKSQISNPKSHTTRLGWASAALALAILGGWMIYNLTGPALAEPYWNEYLVSRNAKNVRPADAENPEIIDPRIQGRWIECLQNVVRLCPEHSAAHLALAEAHWRLFEAMQIETSNAMPLIHIRDAAVQSRFASREALEEWLSRAVGEHWMELRRCLDHARTALRLCPLEGRAYVYLAELSFLDGGGTNQRRAMIEQALRTRPFDGGVLYAAAGEALLAGDAAGWLDYARRAYRSGPRQQREIINSLAAATADEHLPALVEAVLREFQPDLRGLRMLYYSCVKRCSAEKLIPLTRRLAELAETEAAASDGAAAAGLWLEAGRLRGQLGDAGDAVRCAERAVQCDADNFNAHRQLAQSLLVLRSFADAETHFRWCLQRAPNDRRIEEQLRAAMKGRMENQRQATAGEGERIR